VPTLAGALLALALLAAAGAACAAGAGRFLAEDAPIGRGVLVVEGWLPPDALSRAAATWRRGGYDALVVSGGPIEPPEWGCGYRTYAERAAATLRALGIEGPAVVVVPAPPADRDRTLTSALAVREWLAASGLQVAAVDVFTLGPHARRSRALYRRALGDGVAVGVYAAPPRTYDLGRWWRRSDGAREVLSEAAAWAWTAPGF
jgi:hypothetical protein